MAPSPSTAPDEDESISHHNTLKNIFQPMNLLMGFIAILLAYKIVKLIIICASFKNICRKSKMEKIQKMAMSRQLEKYLNESKLFSVNGSDSLAAFMNKKSQLGMTLENQITANLVKPLPENVITFPVVADNEDWRQSITREFRQKFVFDLLNYLYSNPKLAAINKIYSAAMDLEAEIYSKARSRTEYFYYLAKNGFVTEEEFECNRDSNDEDDLQEQLVNDDLLRWQDYILLAHREKVIGRFVRSVFRGPGEAEFQNLQFYATLLEYEIYDKAESWPEYFHLLAEDAYFSIKQEVEENRLSSSEYKQWLQLLKQGRQELKNIGTLEHFEIPVAVKPILSKDEIHNVITPMFRQIIITRLAKCFESVVDFGKTQYEHSPAYIAKKIEREAYEKAQNRLEYYQTLNEKYYEVRKELKERRKQLKQPRLQKLREMCWRGPDESNDDVDKPVEDTKEWHQAFSPSLRNDIVQKVAEAIDPASAETEQSEDRKRNLIAFATKLEAELYDKAETRSEYYHLLAEKVYSVQKAQKNDEERPRTDEQQQTAEQADPASGDGASDRSKLD